MKIVFDEEHLIWHWVCNRCIKDEQTVAENCNACIMGNEGTKIRFFNVF